MKFLVGAVTFGEIKLKQQTKCHLQYVVIVTYVKHKTRTTILSCHALCMQSGYFGSVLFGWCMSNRTTVTALSCGLCYDTGQYCDCFTQYLVQAIQNTDLLCMKHTQHPATHLSLLALQLHRHHRLVRTSSAVPAVTVPSTSTKHSYVRQLSGEEFLKSTTFDSGHWHHSVGVRQNLTGSSDLITLRDPKGA